MIFMDKLQAYAGGVNDALDGYVVNKDTPEKTIYTAMKYSLEAGGKRLRPVLALAVCEMLEGDTGKVMPYACAIEMIHTYSLVHDDLPSMDNDDYRRGKPTSHKVFGEAIAVLTGDALLNYAFEIISEDMKKNSDNLVELQNRVKALGEIARASGTTGMIGGQVVDLESEGKAISAEQLKYMHRCKTGALIKAPVIASAMLCGAGGDDLDALSVFAENLGLAFQIKDDILDVEGDFENLGKPVGSDTTNGKSTFITLYGLEKSKGMLKEITEDGMNALDRFGEKAAFLRELAEYLVNRNN